jgi:hypothetical protein
LKIISQAGLCNLSIGQVSDFREIFRQIDLDKSGSIDEKELGQLLLSIHIDDLLCTDEYIRELIVKVKSVQKESDIERDALAFTVRVDFTFYYHYYCYYNNHHDHQHRHHYQHHHNHEYLHFTLLTYIPLTS